MNSSTSYYVFMTTIILNFVGITVSFVKIGYIMNPKVNKCFSQISIWMLKQLIFGMAISIILAFS